MVQSLNPEFQSPMVGACRVRTLGGPVLPVELLRPILQTNRPSIEDELILILLLGEKTFSKI